MFPNLLDAALDRLVVRGRLTLRHADGSLRRFGLEPGPEAGFAVADAAATRRLVLNPAGRAQRNVAHHYDLNGALYGLFPDHGHRRQCGASQGCGCGRPASQGTKKQYRSGRLQRPERCDRPRYPQPSTARRGRRRRAARARLRR
ncbi:MAG: hypothetical protein O9325_20240 [Roseomonas sp.]|nr:hypothetical protein [Roseomonas sp.]